MTDSTDKHLNTRRRGAGAMWYMRALGRETLPETLEVNGRLYTLLYTVKHDFFAATGFYETDNGHRVVLKVSRTTVYAGLPLLWMGKKLCEREMRFYRRLSDLPNVPALLGTHGPTGLIHDYVPGRPLSKDHPIPDGFFDRLVELMHQLHARDVAYVDTNKPENILLGEDGLPHLIDFQISFDLHRRPMLPIPLPRSREAM